MGSTKQWYYNDIIDIETFNVNLLKIDKETYKGIDMSQKKDWSLYKCQ